MFSTAAQLRTAAGVTLVRMQNSKIAEEQEFFDNMEFMRQLGVMK